MTYFCRKSHKIEAKGGENVERCMAIAPGIQMAALVHDLKTPMSVASGAAQLALDAGGKDVSAQLQQILQAMGTMDRMLNMMGEGAAQTRERTFTGTMLRGELLMMTQGKAAQKAQKLSIDLSALPEMPLYADYTALCRLLTNLLGNAVKYTQRGGEVTLRAQMEHGWRMGQRRIRFVVADNGPGMTHAFMRRMYTPFARAQETADEPGKGLGLAIARDMVRRLGGTIRVSSGQGQGTTFVVCVPVRMRGN